MKTILVPTDFSEQAEYALNLAVQIAREAGDSEIKLVNILEWSESSSFNTTGEVRTEASEGQALMTLLLDQNKKLLSGMVNRDEYADVQISTSTEIGNAYKGIAKAIAETEADLLIMGTKGASGLDEIMVGSNTERVVRHAKCPVITLHEKMNLEDIQNIVFATNLKEDQSHLVDELKKVQKITGATIHIVRVNTPNHFQVDRATERQFEQFLNQYKLIDYTTNIYNDINEEDGILDFASSLPHCLIAIGTHGRTGIKHLLSGSIAEDLVNHSLAPVWTMAIE